METSVYIIPIVLIIVLAIYFFQRNRRKNTKILDSDDYEKIYPSLQDQLEKSKDSGTTVQLDDILEPYRGEKKKKPINDFLKRRAKNLNQQESTISPRITNKKNSKEPSKEKGKLLFAIPHKMTIGEAHRCVVRLGTSFAVVLKELQVGSKPKITDVPIGETMKVELMDYTQNAEGKGLYFDIRSFNSPVQLIEIDSHTEWQFDVTPLKTGNLPLLLRISIVKMVNGVERYKETVKEIVTEVTAAGGEAGIETTIDVTLEEEVDNHQKVRLQSIDKSLHELYHLLSEYETLTDLETDPRTKMRYAKEMEDLRNRISYYEQEKITLT